MRVSRVPLNNFIVRSMGSARYGTAKAEKSGPARRIVSGIQPTGSLHLGNYLGAIKKWVELQNSGEEAFYSIADLHAITVPQDPKTLQQGILEMTASLLACGVDPKKCVLFQQSKVVYHTQLCWVLASLTTMAKLGQQAQLREKRNVLQELSTALYLYPVLQAADILLYKATLVPVGEDQISHLNLASFLARTFNKRFGNTFPIPQALINEDSSRRLKSLRNPLNKMSKSDQDPRSRINLYDSADEILTKCKKAVTDCVSAVAYDPDNRPGISNLLVIHSSLTGKSIDAICQEAAGKESGEYKMTMANEIIEVLCPIREKYLNLMKEPAYLEQVLQAGAQRAEIHAQETWQDVTKRIGIGHCYTSEKNLASQRHNL
ncbi:tryptophan--tRNA ligase, mitochondrial [Thrips palmi]|uniref:Tryptophan--tRNA ligase, mitochondrial n=1 Tax=Thrips palmi TaxID=161013 RepID=A0A6P8ZMY8_THRPL|nr:tryptophan--tRNA ligase, mitochondrial [Thrips palmi]